MPQPAPTQYVTDANLAARQRLWAVSTREPSFSLFDWVLDVAGLAPASDADVLDVGCGNGAYEQKLSARGHRGQLVALDHSYGMVETIDPGIASRVQADAQALPVRSASFDVVLAPHMLYHVPDVPAAAAECRRALRPGGLFVAVTNGATNIAGYLDLVERAVGSGWQMSRPAEERFSLENGYDQLVGAFENVERVDCPPSEVIVTDVDALAGYVGSVGDHYGEEVEMAWDEVVDRVRALATEAIATRGALRWSTSMGAFVCR